MRCFIVGNGPSLGLTNLNKLIGEVSFATNNIHLIYDKTEWRPAHYVRAEEANTDTNADTWKPSIDIHKELCCEMWCNHMFAAGGHEIIPCTHYRRHYNDTDCPALWHLPILCGFGSSVNVAIQIAHTLGYSPIYLVGCDLGKDMDHFDEKYRHGGEQENKYANLDALQAHIIASRMGIDIRNATVGGELEVYKRVEYASLFDR